MQNSNPSPNSFSVPFPYCLSEALARAYARAREATAGAVPSASDIFAACARGRPQPGHQANEHPDAGSSDDTDLGTITGQLDIGELLGVMREPIAWVFTLAERRAQGDPVDVAAIQRVRDATLHRVDVVIAGAVASEPPRIRAADLLTVASLLVGTLDPAIVRRTAQRLGGGLIEALAALWPLGPSFAGDATEASESFTGSYGPDPGAPSWYCDYAPRPAVRFVSPYGGPLGVPFGGPHIARPPVPPCYWPHAGFAF